MSDLSTLSLFSTIDVPPEPLPPRCEEKRDRSAREFIRWCFSFGADFRNSPDILNLQRWAVLKKIKLSRDEETETLTQARSLYLKRIDQLLKKPEPPAGPVPAGGSEPASGTLIAPATIDGGRSDIP